MFHSYHVPPNFEREWRTIGEAMERYFAHKGANKPNAAVYAKVENLEHSFLDTMVRVAALFVVACAMLCTLCYCMELDRNTLGSRKEEPKMELKSDFFAQPAFAFDNQNKQNQLSGSSLHPQYQPGFGLPRRFGSND